MSRWKRARGWTEAHGWGPDELSRLIGRQRREARRHNPSAPRLSSTLQDALLEEAKRADEAERLAWETYQTLPREAPRELFDLARAAHAVADERRDAARIALRALTA